MGKKKTELRGYQITFHMNREVIIMNTFSETETILKTAIILSQNSVKDIAEACGIKANTLYKWKTNQ